MRASSLFQRTLARLRDGERGFALLEVVIAMVIIFLALSVLAYTALVGFRNAGLARQRQVATAIADKLVEETKGLSWTTTISHGLSDSDLSGDSNIVQCGTTYNYQSCSGETIVHNPGLSNATPLVPHQGTFGTADGLKSTYSWSVYLTQATGVPTSGVFRLTVVVSWASSQSSNSTSVSTQTLLYQPQGTTDSTTHVAGASGSFFYGNGTVSPGQVVVTPNAGVYNGTGVTGLSSWDSVTQSLYSLDADIEQEQVTKVSGKAALSSQSKSVSSTVTTSGGTILSSAADDDPTTTTASSSAPSSINQTGTTVSVTGGGNAVSAAQFTQSISAITLRASTSNTSNSANITLSKPSGTTSGDVMIAQVAIQGGANDSITAPSGWTLVRADWNASGRAISWIFSKVAGSSEPASYVFNTSGSAVAGGILDYIGVNTTTPVNVSGASQGNSLTPTAPSVTTSVANQKLISFWTLRSGTLASTDGQMTQRWLVGSPGGSSVAIASAGADQAIAAIGATGTRTATVSGNNLFDWVGQSIALQPAITTGTAGTESAGTTSLTKATSTPPCGNPTQTDNQPCAYTTNAYTAGIAGVLETYADLTGSALGTCPLYWFDPPTNNPTNSAYGRRVATSGDGKIAESVSRSYGTHIFGELCTGITGAPTGWQGYYVKYDAGTSACSASAEAGVSSAGPSVTTCGTVSVWNGAGYTSSAAPSSGGTWTTQPANLSFTTTGGYTYTLTANLGSNPSSTSQSPSGASGSATRTEAKAVVGSPVAGTITYQLTDPSSHVLVNVTMTIDLGNCTAYAKYTQAT